MPTTEFVSTGDDAGPPRTWPRPEVLAPAGSPEALQAAVHAGADAVYFGLTDFNARIRARNFTLGELPDILTDLHRWGVHAYVTFNTLIFLEEEASARKAIEAIARAGADALIVQDLGVVRWIRQIDPDVAIHASTQMTVTSADGVAFVQRLGASRVVLGRELSIPEIAKIRAATDMELEVFVHGALCVSYSGQCLSSEAWGGRSANRGQCAQACRLPYDLLVDGSVRDLGDRAYLLSPRDLEGYLRIPDLTRLGISTFKIEGRMKGPEYVSSATRLYRAAVDRAWAKITAERDVAPAKLDPGRGAVPQAVDSSEHAPQRRGDSASIRPGFGHGRPPSDAEIETLARQARQMFSRGSSEGFLAGVNHQLLVDGRTRSHRGLLVGHTVRVEPSLRSVVVESVGSSALTDYPLRAGDGVLLAVSALEDEELGGRLFTAEPLPGAQERPTRQRRHRPTDRSGAPPSPARKNPESGDRAAPGLLRLVFARESCPDLTGIEPGTPVYRTSSVALHSEIERRIREPDRRIPLIFTVTGRAGEKVRIEVEDPDGTKLAAHSASPAMRAERNALDRARIAEQLGRLGETRYVLTRLDAELEEGIFLPVSELNRVRRELVAELETIRGRTPREAPRSGIASRDPSQDRAAARDASPGTTPDDSSTAHEAGSPSSPGTTPEASSPSSPGTAQKAGAPTFPSTSPEAGSPSSPDTPPEADSPSSPDTTPEAKPQPSTVPEAESPNNGASATPIGWAVARAERTDAQGHTPIPHAARSTAPSSCATTPAQAATRQPNQDSDSFEDRVLVLCRDQSQVEGALSAGARRIVLDFLDLVGLKDATERLRRAGARVCLALPRVQKPGEERIESYFLARRPDEILVRSFASLERLRLLGAAGAATGSARTGRAAELSVRRESPDPPLLIGDVSLNAVNPATVHLLLAQGLARLAPGLDLNGEQLVRLAAGGPADRLEIPLHHHLPVFHTEHCVFAAFLSDGADFRSCGRPCDRHRIALRDRTGEEHPVIADVGCRNTVFGARPQSVLTHLEALRRLEVGTYRLEMAMESARETAEAISLYRRVWNRALNPAKALALLRAEGRYGVSTGSPEPPRRLESKPAGGRRPETGRGPSRRP